MNDFSLDPKFAKLTPASFAMYCSGGRWKLARHLALLNRELMNIATGKTKRLMVSMPPRPQPVDTNILMANGRYKPLANIQVGDEVISHKGVKRKVLNIIDAGIQPILTINTSTNIKIKLAESHRVGIEDQGWKEANKIEPGDRLVSLYNIKLENPVSLDPKLAYVLGIFCSLGIRRKDGVSSVCRAYKVLDKYRSEYFYTNEKGTLIFLTKAGENALRSIGWTEPKRFPSIAWNLDDDTFIPFIAGFLITENKPTNMLRRDLPVGHLEDASKLLLNYGILSCCSYTNRGSILNIFRKPTVQYIKDIFAQKILTRQNDGPRYISHKITAIESTPPEPCICLEVEEDHSYIADTYVSHNSGKCVAEDQEVFRCDGKPIPIKDIKVGDKVFSVGESNKVHQDTVLHKVESGRKKCCKITTKNGKSLISSLDHKYLTIRGYTRLEEIKPDEFIAYLDGDKVRWSKVIKLDKLGMRNTYDLQIENNNNFIANGLVVHNSELVSKYFPAWYLGTFPDKQLIFSTYQAEFAAEFGAAARDLLAEYGEHVFGLSVREGSASASRWRIEDRLGIMQCAGVGGPLTGKGADCLIIDDPIKNDQEAESLVMRNKIFNWFGATAYTRLMPGGSVIIVMTRWHCDDLIGRLLDKVQQEQGEEWKYIKLSAIATEDEPEPPLALGRKRGEALWPEMWPIEKLNSIKNSGAISSYYWSALYQQEPAPEGGGIFKKSSFRYFTQQGDYYILELPNGERKYVEDNKCNKIITVDTANKVTNTSDYTAMGVWAITPDGDILLTHLVRDRIGYADILNKLIYLNGYYRPQFIGIENMGIAIQLITEARLKNLPVKALEPEGKGKQNRANLPMGAVIRMENGKIYFPKHASYLDDIELELLTFPKGKSDEIVDILSYLCNELTKVDMFDNSDFMPYSLEQGLPSGMRKNH